ncbi:MAG: S41 family peptidase [Odoribacter sp.]
MYNNKLKVIILPLIIVLAIVLGMVINSFFNRKTTITAGQETYMPTQGSKLDAILNMINFSYVDSVNIKEIEENAIPQILKDLDPHTVYIPAKDMQRVNEDMVGNFGGIGVQFYKYLDTVTVVKIVPGGPSEAAGLQDGDRIVKVGDSIVAGRKLDTDRIMKMMRGEIGTEVALTLVRRGVAKPFLKKVTRGSIPIKSVDIAYMLNDTTGFIKVKTFGMNTYDEFVESLADLQTKGMRRLIIDLRENEGGILPIAIRMINEFLPEGKLILYTQGKASPRIDYNSNGKGKYQHLPMTVLINEFSASASEIFAGAIQDNDRGNIIGRRSFGKGLVQEQRVLADGSALRLTVARYYTPSGRSIQKPYDEGKEKYYNDIYQRLLHGEFAQKDSIHFDEKLKFQTVGGRTVYGGGGIMPDIFVPEDTLGFSKYLVDVSRKNQYLYEYTFDFMDRHRNEMKEIKDYKQLLHYLKQFNLVEEMANYTAKRGLKRDEKGIRESHSILDMNIKAFIGRHTLDDNGFYPIFYINDVTMKKAIEEQGKDMQK